MRILGIVVGVVIIGLGVFCAASNPSLLSARSPAEEWSAPFLPSFDPDDGFPTGASPNQPILLADGWDTPVNISDTPGPSGAPIIGVDSQGGLHVAWYDNAPNNWEILYTSHSITGSWTLPENVSRNASYSLVPFLLVEPNDVVDLVWQDYGGPRIAWQGTLLFKNKEPGQDFAPPEAISATTGFGGFPEVRDPHLAVDSHATIHMVWAGSTRVGYRIFYAYRPSGGVWSFPRAINLTWGTCFRPRIVVDARNTLHVVWQETVGGDAQSDIYYTYLSSGDRWAPPINISANSGVSQAPWIIAGANNTVHLVWRDDTNNPEQGEILYAQRSADGRWSSVQNVSETVGDSAGPVIVEDVGGTLHLVWYDNTPGNWEILYASKPAGGSWTSGANVSNTPGKSGQPHLTYDVRGRLHLTWADDTPGDFDIYYASKVVPVFGTSVKQAPATALPGEDVRYELRVRNLSTLPVTVFVTDRVPVEMTYVAGSAQASAGILSVVDDEVHWTASVPARGEIWLRLLANVGQSQPVGTMIRNRAVISDDNGISITVEATTRLVQVKVMLPIVMH